MLEKMQGGTVAGCQVPLHVAFHNLIAASPRLNESVLMYEPVRLEAVHLMLRQHGHAYQMDVSYSSTVLFLFSWHVCFSGPPGVHGQKVHHRPVRSGAVDPEEIGNVLCKCLHCLIHSVSYCSTIFFCAHGELYEYSFIFIGIICPQ